MYGKFIYFSSDESKYDRQCRERARINESYSPKKLSDSLGIVALVEVINNPGFCFKEISEHLKNTGVDVSEVRLRDFFKCPGILKKTLDSRR